MGCQTDEPINIGRPKTTQTEMIERNDTEIQVDDVELKSHNQEIEIIKQEPTIPSNSFLQMTNSLVSLRNQFYLPNLISGSLLAFAGKCSRIVYEVFGYERTFIKCVSFFFGISMSIIFYSLQITTNFIKTLIYSPTKI